MVKTGEAPTQRFARGLMAKGYNGLLVHCFEDGSEPDDLNLVLWKWPECAGSPEADRRLEPPDLRPKRRPFGCGNGDPPHYVRNPD
jgi:hypothetical protein